MPLIFQLVGGLHNGRPQTVGPRQQFEVLGRQPFEPERLGDETYVTQLLPAARQRALHTQEASHAGAAGVAHSQVWTGFDGKPIRKQPFDFAVDERAPLHERQTMGDDRGQILGQHGAAGAALAGGDAHQGDLAQAIAGADWAGCLKLQGSGRHGRWPLSHWARAPEGRREFAAIAGRANHRRFARA